MSSRATTDAIQKDWKEREMIEVVHLNILKITKFLNEFEMSVRYKLSALAERVGTLERHLEICETAVKAKEGLNGYKSASSGPAAPRGLDKEPQTSKVHAADGIVVQHLMDNSGADAGAGGHKQQQEEHGQQQQQRSQHHEGQQRNRPQRGGRGGGSGNRGGGRGRGERGGKGRVRHGGGGRGRGAWKGGRRAGNGIDHGGGVYSKPGRKGPRVRGSHVGPGTFGCGRLGLLFAAFRFLHRQTFRRGRHEGERKGQQGHQQANRGYHRRQNGRHDSQAKSQPSVEQSRPYETSNINAVDAGETKVS